MPKSVIRELHSILPASDYSTSNLICLYKVTLILINYERLKLYFVEISGHLISNVIFKKGICEFVRNLPSLEPEWQCKWTAHNCDVTQRKSVGWLNIKSVRISISYSFVTLDDMTMIQISMNTAKWCKLHEHRPANLYGSSITKFVNFFIEFSSLRNFVIVVIVGCMWRWFG